MILGLHADFADLGGSDDEDGFGEAGEEAGEECYRWRRCGHWIATAAGGGLYVVILAVPPSQHITIVLETDESNGHFWNDAGVDGSQSFVQCHGTLSLDDASGGAEGSHGSYYCTSG